MELEEEAYVAAVKFLCACGEGQQKHGISFLASALAAVLFELVNNTGKEAECRELFLDVAMGGPSILQPQTVN